MMKDPGSFVNRKKPRHWIAGGKPRAGSPSARFRFGLLFDLLDTRSTWRIQSERIGFPPETPQPHAETQASPSPPFCGRLDRLGPFDGKLPMPAKPAECVIHRLGFDGTNSAAAHGIVNIRSHSCGGTALLNHRKRHADEAFRYLPSNGPPMKTRASAGSTRHPPRIRRERPRRARSDPYNAAPATVSCCDRRCSSESPLRHCSNPRVQLSCSLAPGNRLVRSATKKRHAAGISAQSGKDFVFKF